MSRKDVVLTLLTVLVFLPTLALLVWFEFVRDIDVKEAKSYFQHHTTINSNKNAAFALAGLLAPKESPDFVAWGIKSQNKVGEYKVGEMYFGSPGSRLDVQLTEKGSHFICWEPAGEKFTDNCISEQELTTLLNTNRIFLNRYKITMSFAEMDFGVSKDPHQLAYEATRQYAITLWQSRDNPTSENLYQVARQLWFWKTVVESQALSDTGFAISLLSYGASISLFYKIAELHPRVFDIYEQNFGFLRVMPINQELFDRLSIGQFNERRASLCLDSNLDFIEKNCWASSLYKPNRTILYLYNRKLGLGDCSNVSGQRVVYRDDESFSTKLESLKRPGNFFGRWISHDFFLTSDLICQTVNLYKMKNELVSFLSAYRNQILKLRKNPSYKIQKSDLKIPYSYHFFKFDSKTNSLKYVNNQSDEEQIYTLKLE